MLGTSTVRCRRIIGVNPWRVSANYWPEKRIDFLLEWMCPDHQVNPIRDHVMYKDLRTRNTAVWIFEHPLYKEWRTGSSSFLWISGKSTHVSIIMRVLTTVGAGKSVLTYCWKAWEILII